MSPFQGTVYTQAIYFLRKSPERDAQDAIQHGIKRQERESKSIDDRTDSPAGDSNSKKNSKVWSKALTFSPETGERKAIIGVNEALESCETSL